MCPYLNDECCWVDIIFVFLELTLKAPSKIAADDNFMFLLLSWLDVSCESIARQRTHMKYQVLFSLKNNEKVFMNVVCCSSDQRFKG